MKRLTWLFVLFFAFTGLGTLAASAQAAYGYRPAPRYYMGYRAGYRPAGFYRARYGRHERWERRRFIMHQRRERARFYRHERWEHRHGRW